MNKGIDQQLGGATIEIRDTTANPAPLGLMGFGMTTVLLNIHNAGFYPLGTMILAMGIFYGGIAQIIAGIMEWKKNNTFGTTAFTSYGLFWLTLVFLLLMPKLGLWEGPAISAMALYLFMWGLFTAVMFIGTLRINRALQFVFGSLALLFFLLAYGDATGSTIIKRIAGYEGIICGFSAIYTALAQVLNEVFGKTIIPIWPLKSVGTADIENVLFSHEAVLEAAVVGFPRVTKGKEFYAFVTLKDGVEKSDELKKTLVVHVRNEIGSTAKMEKIQFANVLPKTPSGKIMRDILWKIAAGDIESIGRTPPLIDRAVVDSLIEGRMQ
jgi:succinate-acetate transporter protein